ncbi:family 1 glycosylhydrolase [Enterobacter kobei]|uniref:family 1 glycosylhydrolase n=1 Tax=Enterobacter kobei TaxID=208224 RepID=UPI0039C20EA7
MTDLFARFARTAFELFGHKVKYWITFNEPIVPVEGGYLYDFHYPCGQTGRTDQSHEAIQNHHIVLATLPACQNDKD